MNPDAVISSLPVGVQQRVEILKALYRGAKVLILDEPTGVLTPQEADALFDILRSLKEQGTTILLITHKLHEIMDVTDRVSVIRRGEMVGHRETAETSPEELAEMMVGRKVLLEVNKALRGRETALSVSGLNLVDDRVVQRLTNVSFEVKPVKSSAWPGFRATVRHSCSRCSAAWRRTPAAPSPSAASRWATRRTKSACSPWGTSSRTASTWGW